MARDYFKHDCAIGHAFCNRAPLVKRGRERDHAESGYPSVCRLKPRHPAKGGGLADASSGIGADGRRAFSRGDGGGASSAAAHRNPFGIPWVQGGEKRGVFRGRAHGKLIHVEFAEYYGPRLFQFSYNGCVVWGDEVFKYAGGAGRSYILCAEDVLYRDGNPGQRGSVSFFNPFIRGLGLFYGAVAAYGYIRVDFFINFFHAPEIKISKLLSTHFLFFKFF